MPHAVVDADRPLAAVPAAFVRVENLVDLLRFVGRRADDLAVLELELDVVEHRALIARLRVEPNAAVDALAHRRGKHFAVRNIPLAPTFDDRNSLDRKLQLRAGRNDPHPVGLAASARPAAFELPSSPRNRPCKRRSKNPRTPACSCWPPGRTNRSDSAARPTSSSRCECRCAPSSTNAPGTGPSSRAAHRQTGCCSPRRGCRCTPAPSPSGPIQFARPASCFPPSPSDTATAARRSTSTTPAAPPRVPPPLRSAGKQASHPANRTPR